MTSLNYILVKKSMVEEQPYDSLVGLMIGTKTVAECLMLLCLQLPSSISLETHVLVLGFV